jgi:fructosamine-3-kinase
MSIRVKLEAKDELLELANDYRTREFMIAAHDFLSTKATKIFEDLFSGQDVELHRKAGGAVGVVYLVKSKDKELVIKLTEMQSHFWAEQAGYDFCEKLGVRTPKRYFHGKSESDPIFYAVIENIEPRNLANFLEQNPGDMSWIDSLVENLVKLHNTRLEVYGDFRPSTFEVVPDHISQKDYVMKNRLSPDILNYLLENNIFSQSEIDQLCKRADNLDFTDQNFLIHGDLHIENIFFDKDKREVILFDFNSSSADPMFDLGRIHHSLVANNHKTLWHKFLEAYSKVKDINHDRLDTMSLVALVKYIQKAHVRCEGERLERLVNEFREVLN